MEHIALIFLSTNKPKVGVASSEPILHCSLLQCPLLLNKTGRKRKRKHKRDAADLSNTG